MGLAEELERIARAARAFAEGGEEVTAIIAAEPDRARVFLCAFESAEHRTWLALDRDGGPIDDRTIIRDAVTIAALCELAEETAGGGDVDELAARLEELRRTESPEGIESAQAALGELAATLEEPPRVASPAYLDRIGAAARRLEQALGAISGSPFAEAMTRGTRSVEGLVAEVEGAYKSV